MIRDDITAARPRRADPVGSFGLGAALKRDFVMNSLSAISGDVYPTGMMLQCVLVDT